MDANQELISNTLALNVALKTMKERCLSLQKHTDYLQQKLLAVEKENIYLKNNKGLANIDGDLKMKGSVSEIAFLKAQNQELLNQKSILNENIKLISKENRILWKRLSELTGEDQMIGNNENVENGKIISPHSQIVRSRTFTIQHNPKLKERNTIDTDLEDISLESYGERQNEVDSNKMFGYLQDSLQNDESNDVDNVKKVAEGLLCIKKELLKQQSDLKVALTNWKKFKSPENCKVCKERAKIVKPVMVDKTCETDVELTIELDMDESAPNSLENDKNQTNVIDLSEAKNRASSTLKICPMCGEFFEKTVTFEKFQEHVEGHFLLEQEEPHNPLDFELVGLGNF